MSFKWPDGCRAALSLSFDDARPSQIDHGLGVLDHHGIKATFYVTPRQVLLRPDDWRAAAQTGHEIGNHTYNHPCSVNYPWSRDRALESYTLEGMTEELDACDAFIRQTLGVDARSFAYPCGQAYVGRGRDRRSYVPLIADRYLVGRGWASTVPNAPGLCDLACVMASSMDNADLGRLEALVAEAMDQRGWLVLVAHDVGTSGRQSIATDVLDRFCRRISQLEDQLWCDTVAAVGEGIAVARER